MGNIGSHPSFYNQTAIQVNGYGSGPLFLRVPSQGLLPQDVGVNTVAKQNQGSLFDVPYGNVSDVFNGFSAVGSATGPLGNGSDIYFAYGDAISLNQPVLFALADQITNEPFTSQIFCNVDPDSNPKGLLYCEFESETGLYPATWAICNLDNYSKGDLFMYYAQAYNNTAPPLCQTVTLTVLAVPGAT